MTKIKGSEELLFAKKQINHLEELLITNFKELSDYKYALDESSIIAITDQKGIIKKVNKNFCKISKYSEQELIGQDHCIINSGHHSKEFIRDLWLTIANGEIWKGEIKNKAKDGSIYWVDTTIVPFLNEQRKPYQYLAIRSDITERKNAEEYLLQRTSQLENANKNLLTFNYVSSHDLQEPLRKIQTFITILLDEENQNLSDSGKHNLHRLQLAALRSQQLIQDFLNFSSIATIDLEFEKTDFNLILEEVKTELKVIINEKQAIIEASNLCELHTVAIQFKQLIHNLISNSLKFSHPDRLPHIILKSKITNGSEVNNPQLLAEKKYHHITISDNGIGFDQKYKDRIFEIFQRLHSKDNYDGTGVGLAIVKKIIENHNGIIHATSLINKGTTFDIYIPVS
jgi:chemotaxis family two-component system sensor kinase Cph1